MAKINTENEYKAIMTRIDELFFSTSDCVAKDDPRLLELDVLSALVEEYEKEHFPIKPPTLAETIEYRMREMKCTQKEVAAILGISASRLSDIINGKKEPTYQQARLLATKLAIDPAIVLAV